MGKFLGLIIAVFGIMGCQSTSREVVPLPEICVVNNPDVRPAFNQALMQGLSRHQIPIRLIDAHIDSQACQWLLSYRAHWLWPAAAYMQSAMLELRYDSVVLASQRYDLTRDQPVAMADHWINGWLEVGICQQPEYQQAIAAAVASRPWFDLLSQQSLPCPTHHL